MVDFQKEASLNNCYVDLKIQLGTSGKLKKKPSKTHIEETKTTEISKCRLNRTVGRLQVLKRMMEKLRLKKGIFEDFTGGIGKGVRKFCNLISHN